jgi:hypothetical protein
MLQQSEAAKLSIIWRSWWSRTVSLSGDTLVALERITTAAANPALSADRREQEHVESKCISDGAREIELDRSDGEPAGTGVQRKYDTRELIAGRKRRLAARLMFAVTHRSPAKRNIGPKKIGITVAIL